MWRLSDLVILDHPPRRNGPRSTITAVDPQRHHSQLGASVSHRPVLPSGVVDGLQRASGRPTMRECGTWIVTANTTVGDLTAFHAAKP